MLSQLLQQVLVLYKILSVFFPTFSECFEFLTWKNYTFETMSDSFFLTT